MKWGALSDLFEGVAWKRLTPHEVDPAVSNGHEFQGVSKLRDVLGADGPRALATTYLILSDDDPEITTIRSVAKWYDSRSGNSDRRPEWRLYYPAEVGRIQASMHAGDLMALAVMKDGSLVVMLAPAASAKEAALQLLFGLGDIGDGSLRTRRFEPDSAIGFLASEILEELGIASPTPEAVGDGAVVLALAHELSHSHPARLPEGKDVSALMHARIADVDPVADPDGTLVRWIEAEETVFRLWEDGLIERRLQRGFARDGGGQDVQGFRDFSMSIRQSRVSRAGRALELHAAYILSANQVQFDVRSTTENGERPDFLFPGAAAYHDPKFNADRLRMLAAKFTAKDRWRQVLHEALRIRNKHLLTMEATISLSQLEGMKSGNLQPVVPRGYLELYSVAARPLLISFGTFVQEVRAVQQLIT
jgi:hypothetical protein